MCGIVGIYSRDSIAPVHLREVLEQLEHRGGDGVGVAAAVQLEELPLFDGLEDDSLFPSHVIKVAKGQGRLKQAYRDDWPTGTAMIGHTRYRTEGGRGLSNVQPLGSVCKRSVLAHNGELTNAEELASFARLFGVSPAGSSDSNAMVAAFTVLLHGDASIQSAVFDLMGMMRGSYSVVMLVDEQLVAFRDPYGNRPLFVAEIPGGHMVASEDGPMSIIQPENTRAVKRGECLIIGESGVESYRFHDIPESAHPCIFENVYFARPDTTTTSGKSISSTRFSAGRRLWKEHPVDADVVVQVPDSSLDAAAGFAEASELRLYSNALVKNRGRSFTVAGQAAREVVVRKKFNPLCELFEGKRVVLVDDSIVRGTTLRVLVQMIRDAGATEVHVRIAAPPVRYPCFYGIDMKTKDQLIASGVDVETVRATIGPDSLGYVSNEELIEACGGGTHCTACFTGEYHIPR